MPFIHGKGAATLFDKYDLSAYLNTFESSASADTAEVTTFGASSKSYIAGMKDATISLGGFFDGATGAVDEVLAAALSNATTGVLTLAPAGAGAIGNRAQLGNTLETSYTVTAAASDAVSISAEAQITGGLSPGIILADLAARTAAGNTTANDNTASSANGLAAHLHCTAFTGTNITVKVAHSADNSTWADLITFTQLTAAGSERKTVTGTVNRYLRITTTGTFTSATFAVAVARL
jgi:hypothetical protein